jgi:UV DNA damage endonuclease
MPPQIVLGYAGQNVELRKDHIFMSRTCRMATLHNSPIGLQLAVDMMQSNLEDTLKILKWNKRNNVMLFRMGSDFAPHITNPEFLKPVDREDYRKLVYSPAKCKKILARIGAYARKHKMRLTFHPDPFIVLGTPRMDVLIKSKRELYFHARVLDLMGLDLNSVIVLHGGGTYGNKQDAIVRWTYAFNHLPVSIKRRIVIENDEYSFNTSDMLKISKSVKPFALRTSEHSWKQDRTYRIPVVFDTFHYECYDRALRKRWRQQSDEGRAFEPDQMQEQLMAHALLPLVSRSWGSRIMKMHISNQKPSGQLGAHSDYITLIPTYLSTLPADLKRDRIDLMVEAKMKEKAVLRLRKKYPKIFH